MSRRQTSLVLGLSWAVTRSLLAVMVVHDIYRRRWVQTDIAGDVRVDYWHAAQSLMAGKVPYLGFHYEYPPGTLPLVFIARVVGGADVQRFTVAWVGLVLMVDLVVVVALARWAGERAVSVGSVWVFGVAAMGPLALLRNDMFVACAFVLGAYWICTARTAGGGAMWALGIVLKLWPAIPLALVLAGRRERRWRLVLGATSVLVVTLAAVAALGALGAMATYLSAYQGRRPLEIESMAANVGWLASLVTGHHLFPRLAFHSFSLISPRTLVLAAWASRLTALLPSGLVAAVFVVQRRLERDVSWPSLAWLWLAALSAGFVLTPVLSPQYALWLVAAGAVLVALDDGRPARQAAVIVVLVAALSQVVFPFTFTSLRHGDPLGVLALTARNLAIVLLLGFSLAELTRGGFLRGGATRWHSRSRHEQRPTHQ